MSVELKVNAPLLEEHVIMYKYLFFSETLLFK